jgi:hypothetical protein
MPQGLDADYVTGGVDYGPVRRPLPIAKAFQDAILAYEMNGQPIPPDNGYPVRLIVPGWVGVSNIKWVGQIQVAKEPLYSYWNTTSYILEGDAYPTPIPLTNQVVKSAFEVAFNATLPNQFQMLTGRSWSGSAPIKRVDISTDGGTTWRPARLRFPTCPTRGSAGSTPGGRKDLAATRCRPRRPTGPGTPSPRPSRSTRWGTCSGRSSTNRSQSPTNQLARLGVWFWPPSSNSKPTGSRDVRASGARRAGSRAAADHLTGDGPPNASADPGDLDLGVVRLS